jgi:hypothetical protein
MRVLYPEVVIPVVLAGAVALCVAQMLGCTSAEKVCPDMARREFPAEMQMLGIKIESADSMVILREGDFSPDVRAYICSDRNGPWELNPVGVISIDQKPVEKETP